MDIGSGTVHSMTEPGTFNCGRRIEDGCGPGSPFSRAAPGATLLDKWRDDNTCSYCGSFNPEELLKRLEAGDVELGPTDKNYKVYLKNVGGALFKHTYRKCPIDGPRHGPNECAHWVTEERDDSKFYFQHFTKEQCIAFIDLLNAGKLKIGYPGHFYRRPFFIAPPAQKVG